MDEAGSSPYAPTPEHEAKCRRCGMSCHFAIEFGGERLIVPEIHCLYLGSADGKFHCTVYERRFELAPWCQTSGEAAKKGWLGWDCPYSAGPAAPKGKRWATPADRDRIMPHVRKALIENGLERKYNPDSALKALAAPGEAWSWRLEGERYVFERREAAGARPAK